MADLDPNANSHNIGMTIEPFEFNLTNKHFEVIYPHSDNEENDDNKHRKIIMIPQSPNATTSTTKNATQKP